MTPLAQRVVTAAVLVPLVLVALFLLPPLPFAIALLAVMVAAAYEWASLTRLAGTSRLAFVGSVFVLASALLFVPVAGFARGWPDAVVIAACGAATIFWALVATPWVIFRWPVRSPLAMALVGWVVLLGVWVAIVQLQARSPWLALGAMAVVWIADTAAYFSGRAFGRRKLAPLVSPGKTWEGVAGALAAVAVYALALTPLARAAGYDGPLDVVAIGAWVAFALVVAAVSIVGDLYESWLKRSAGVKDSGRLLPGHGGVLDRIDALLAAMPPAALAAQAWLR
jgi:phosphatidate cytidylyltransferase